MRIEYSAIVTTYKRDIQIVERAVNSILQQTNQNYEILLIDDNEDNSTYSQALSSRYADNPRIRYIKQKGSKGACAARNLGILHASAEYIAFLDDDDTWEPQKAEKQLEKFGSAAIGMVYCLGNVIDENYDPPKKEAYYTASHFKEEAGFYEMLQTDYAGSTSQAMIRKECFQQCGGFDEKLPARQDYEMWLRISRKYRIAGVKEKLFNHYMHKGEQISKNPVKSMKGYRRIHRLYKEDYRHNREAEKMWLLLYTREAKKAHSLTWFFYKAKQLFLYNS